MIALTPGTRGDDGGVIELSCSGSQGGYIIDRRDAGCVCNRTLFRLGNISRLKGRPPCDGRPLVWRRQTACRYLHQRPASGRRCHPARSCLRLARASSTLLRFRALIRNSHAGREAISPMSGCAAVMAIKTRPSSCRAVIWIARYITKPVRKRPIAANTSPNILRGKEGAPFCVLRWQTKEYSGEHEH